ncbi:MAG TPA: tRNA preQ1(34) S-adenosylmethionine ribosyltransferase-isomerase QueA, partial [Caulobacteraceae bacterium]
MTLAEFDFDLPPERIALRPAAPRDHARLLEVSADGELADRTVADLPSRLRPGDAVVFNDTKVIAARLIGRRERDGHAARIEATLHRRLGPSRWAAFVRPAKRLEIGDRIAFGETRERACSLSVLDAAVAEKGEGGEVSLEFDLAGDELDRAVDLAGLMPLPPYIAGRRAEDERDRADYQTVYAKVDGSVAAPTAGLHFTPQLLRAMTEAGLSAHFVTLQVGAGTFLPIKTETLERHVMHAETGFVDADTAAALNAARARGGRIVCVGTTSLRLIETATDADGQVRPFSGETRLFITQGYRFRAADALMTNFHLPKSTLFMLVSALIGRERMQAAYAHAIA